jgi:ABC-type transport system substrate-binding protein
MFHISRWKRPTIASSITLSVLALSAALTSQAIAAGKTITAVMHSDLRVIDPGMTTAYITRDHGYMVYDTLLATDSNFKIQPQMADWKVSDDNLTYTFTLRDGLKWHDGAPVTAEDCVASLKRWGKAGLHREYRSHRRQDHHPETEGALRPGAGVDRKTLFAGAVHDAQAFGGNAARQTHSGTDRLRPLQVRAGRIPARREGGL